MENKINIYEEKFTSVLRIFFLTFGMLVAGPLAKYLHKKLV